MKISDKSVKLIGARVLVKQHAKSDVTSSGIVLPGEKDKMTNKGTVIAVGPGAILENGEKVPMQVEVGDVVLFPSYTGIPLKASDKDEETYLIIIERDLLCSIKE